MKGSSRTRSKQLAARPLIQPHEVLRMRADEQIVFTAGNAPLRCGRAIWFRRDDMKACVGSNRFHKLGSPPEASPIEPARSAASKVDPEK
jgi:type IV secretion system protein VirD4